MNKTLDLIKNCDAEKICIIDEKNTYSYGDLNRRCQLAANIIESRSLVFLIDRIQ